MGNLNEFNILVSSGGRRLELMQCLRAALRDNSLKGGIFVADCSLDAPAVHLADKAWQVPLCTNPEFTEEILRIARRENVRLVIPTIDGELGPFASCLSAFALNDTHVSVSDPETVKICGDKVLTHRWLTANGFPTVRQSTPAAVLSCSQEWRLPLIAKPRNGSASKGVRVIESFEKLELFSESESDLIVQEMAHGDEHTINVFVNKHGKCVSAVPHQRLEVRSGEVSKAVTVKNHRMMKLASEIAEALPGARNILNIQCFRSADNDIRVIEINARVGGGYPLAHRAGAQFTHWIVEEILGLPARPVFEAWQDDLAMLRYDQAVFLPGTSIRQHSRNTKQRQTGRALDASQTLFLDA
ncbi:MAG: ATP-grasp domain-containing protein [Bryobacteraceae bacterium]